MKAGCGADPRLESGFACFWGSKDRGKAHDLGIYLGHWGANVELGLVMTVIVYELPSVCDICDSACKGYDAI
jgi:hypothetical protein